MEKLPELVQYVLRFLAHDHSDVLRTARLVCKTWDRLIDSDVVWGATRTLHPRRVPFVRLVEDGGEAMTSGEEAALGLPKETTYITAHNNRLFIAPYPEGLLSCGCCSQAKGVVVWGGCGCSVSVVVVVWA